MRDYDYDFIFQPTGMGVEGNIHFVEIHQELGKQCDLETLCLVESIN